MASMHIYKDFLVSPNNIDDFHILNRIGYHHQNNYMKSGMFKKVHPNCL